MKKNIPAICLFVFSLTGCVSGQWAGLFGVTGRVSGLEEQNTGSYGVAPSVVPVVTLCGTNKKLVMEALFSRIKERPGTSGESVKMTSYELTVSRKMTEYNNAPGYDRVPEERVVYIFSDEGDGCVFVTGKHYIVTNPDTAFERAMNTTMENAKEIQLTLDRMKAWYERSRPK